MKVAVWPADLAGCGHYRLIFPAMALQAQGADVRVDMAGPVINWDRKWAGADEGTPAPSASVPVSLAQRYEADVVVIQRSSRRLWLRLIPLLQESGVRVVFDVDDLFDSVRKGHIGYRNYHHGDAQVIDECCKLADLVTATTPALVDRYGHGHAMLLPNYVPKQYLSLRVGKKARTVGWSGVVGTHPGDLQTTQGAIQSVLAKTGWTFHTIGPADGVQDALRLRDEPSTTGWVTFQQYAPSLAQLEVGIVPLEDSPFNHAKSCLKAMEMAALGVVPVMSPTPDNLRLHRHDIGHVASSRGQWARTVGRLCADDTYRAEQAAAGRAAMADLTYEQHADRWWSAWRSTLQTKEQAA